MNTVLDSCVLRCLLLRVLLDADAKGARPLDAAARRRMAEELRDRTLLVQAARGGF